MIENTLYTIAIGCLYILMIQMAAPYASLLIDRARGKGCNSFLDGVTGRLSVAQLCKAKIEG